MSATVRPPAMPAPLNHRPPGTFGFRAGKALTYAMLGFWSLVCLFPLYWLAITSLKGEGDIMQGPFYLPLIDFAPTLKSWNFILFDAYENLLRRYLNSLIVASCASGLALSTGAMLVYGATRYGRNMESLLLAALATRLLPPAVLVLPLYMMVWHAGLLDTRTGLILSYAAVNLPVAVWLLLPVIGDKASEQEESALLDGASQMWIFFSVLLPMLRPSLAGTGLLIFVLCWNEYLFAAYLASDQAMTLPPWMVGQLSMKEAQVGGDAEEWAQLSAAMMLMVAPLLCFAAIAQRYLARAATHRG